MGVPYPPPPRKDLFLRLLTDLNGRHCCFPTVDKTSPFTNILSIITSFFFPQRVAACCGQREGTWWGRCQRLNPQNLVLCRLTRQWGLCRCDSLKDLDRGRAFWVVRVATTPLQGCLREGGKRVRESNARPEAEGAEGERQRGRLEDAPPPALTVDQGPASKGTQVAFEAGKARKQKSLQGLLPGLAFCLFTLIQSDKHLLSAC